MQGSFSFVKIAAFRKIELQYFSEMHVAHRGAPFHRHHLGDSLYMQECKLSDNEQREMILNFTSDYGNAFA